MKEINGWWKSANDEWKSGKEFMKEWEVTQEIFEKIITKLKSGKLEMDEWRNGK
jgi:hypothetical protein